MLILFSGMIKKIKQAQHNDTKLKAALFFCKVQKIYVRKTKPGYLQIHLCKFIIYFNEIKKHVRLYGSARKRLPDVRTTHLCCGYCLEAVEGALSALLSWPP